MPTGRYAPSVPLYTYRKAPPPEKIGKNVSPTRSTRSTRSTRPIRPPRPPRSVSQTEPVQELAVNRARITGKSPIPSNDPRWHHYTVPTSQPNTLPGSQSPPRMPLQWPNQTLMGAPSRQYDTLPAGTAPSSPPGTAPRSPAWTAPDSHAGTAPDSPTGVSQSLPALKELWKQGNLLAPPDPTDGDRDLVALSIF